MSLSYSQTGVDTTTTSRNETWVLVDFVMPPEGRTKRRQHVGLKRNETNHDTCTTTQPRKRFFEQTQTQDSIENAISQVNGILDLYQQDLAMITNDVAMSSSSLLYTRVALDAMESVIAHCLEESNNSIIIHDSLLEQLETLVWRCSDMEICPSLSILSGLWSLQQQSFTLQNNAMTNDGSFKAPKASKHVGRSVRLLTTWYRWAEQHGQVDKPPQDLFVYILDFAMDQHVTMSYALWDLYRFLLQEYNTNETDDYRLDGKIYHGMLSILSFSNRQWNTRVVQVLRQMNVHVLNGHHEYQPTVKELQMALVDTARAGRVHECVELLQMMQQVDPVATRSCQIHFVEALLQNNETGSALYMDKFVSQIWDVTGQGDATDRQRAYDLLLRKWATSETQGAGQYAEKAFDRMVTGAIGKMGAKAMVQAVYNVVMSYLREPSIGLSQIMSADSFVRKCVARNDLATRPANETARNFPVFDRILSAYCHIDRSDSPHVAFLTERLFQFFLLQYRKGKVMEEPNSFHLGHLLRLWNKSTSISAARKSLEYFRLLQAMYHRGEITSAPDTFNVRQLLGTLAQSDMPGYGTVAWELLRDVLDAGPGSRPAAYALGHTFWCVIKCQCRDGEYAAALATLQEMEALHEQNPSSVRLTGASYQTILRRLASDSPSNSKIAELASEVIERIESQWAGGNRRTRLTKDLYVDAIRCIECSKDDTFRRSQIERYRKQIDAIDRNS